MGAVGSYEWCTLNMVVVVGGGGGGGGDGVLEKCLRMAKNSGRSEPVGEKKG